jgi:hypothetical protein
MSNAPAETAYFPGEFLTAEDYGAEQAFQIEMQRAGGQALSGWGIARGLAVAPATGGAGLQIASGLAIDSLGRLVLLAANRLQPSATASGQVLTLTYGETIVVTEPGVVGTLLEDPVLAWQTPAAIDPSINIVLGTWDGSQMTTAGRVYAGAPAGSLIFAAPETEETTAVVAWSSDSLRGLRVDTTLMSVVAPLPLSSETPPVETSLSILDGVLGVGTMSPQACLDVLAPSVSLTGPGLLTSYDTVVRGTDPTLGLVLHVGDVLLLTDREGQPRQARVASITSQTELVTDKPLNCLDAPFTYEQALVVSVRNQAKAPALTVDRQAWMGLGVSPPLARLHVGTGDIEVAGQDMALSFGGDGLVTTQDGGSRIAFLVAPPPGGATPAPTSLTFDQVGQIQWLPGRAQTPAPYGMVLTATGNLGIGMAPEKKLDVAGTLQLPVTGSGLVFPDGSVQTSSQFSVPIGAIIDWWQGVASQQPPANFMICAGGQVNDAASPFNGMTLPNLDDRFVFGAVNDSQANTPVGADVHHHGYTVPQHTHGFPHTHADINKGVTGGANHSDGMAGAGDNNAAAGHAHNWTATVGEASTETTAPNSDQGQTLNTQDSSTLPPYVSLLKLIRIK